MLKLKIVSPEKIIFSGNVERIIVPGTLGQFEILKDHAPIISSLEKGNVVYSVNNKEKFEIEINGGFVEVQDNEISLCVEL